MFKKQHFNSHVLKTKNVTIAIRSQGRGSDTTMISPSPASPIKTNVDRGWSYKRVARAQITMKKKTKVNANTITHEWYKVLACYFVQVEGKFNLNEDIIGVFCKSYMSVIGWREMMVSNLDNLEKYKGKRVSKEDSVLGA